MKRTDKDHLKRVITVLLTASMIIGSSQVPKMPSVTVVAWADDEIELINTYSDEDILVDNDEDDAESLAGLADVIETEDTVQRGFGAGYSCSYSDTAITFGCSSDSDFIKADNYKDTVSVASLHSMKTDEQPPVVLSGSITDLSKVNGMNLADYHTHRFRYSVSGGTITATCDDDSCELHSSPATVILSAPSGDIVYDGNSHGVSVTVTGDIDYYVNLVYQKKTANNTWGEAVTEAPKDSGSYRATITLEDTGSGEAAVSAEYSITKRSITVKAKEQAVEDGSDIATGTDQVEITSGKLADGQYIAAVTLSSDETTITPSAVTIMRATKDVTANYDIHYDTGHRTPTQKKAKITKKPEAILGLKYKGHLVSQNLVTGGGADTQLEYVVQYAYDGAGIRQDGTGVKPENGYRTDSEAYNKWKAGTYYVWYRAAADESQNLAPSDAECITVTIAKVPLTVKAEPETIIYGETPEHRVSYTGFVSTDNPSKLVGSLEWRGDNNCDAGSHTITPYGYTSNDYEISFIPSTLTILPKELGLSWGNTDLRFSGQPQAPTASITGLLSGDSGKVSVEVKGAQVNANDAYAENPHYTATAVLTGERAGNYKLPADNTKDFTIAKVPIPYATQHVEIDVPVSANSFTGNGAGQMPLDAGELQIGMTSSPSFNMIPNIRTTEEMLKTCRSITVSHDQNRSGNFTVYIDQNKARFVSGDEIWFAETFKSTNYDNIDIYVVATFVDSKTDAGVTINGNNALTKNLGAGSFQLSADIQNRGSGGSLTWESSNTGVAEVDNTGNVTVKGAGTASITAKYESDSTVGAAFLTLTVKPGSVPVPVAATGLKWTGSAQTGVASNEKYTVTGASATAAGSYIAELTLKDRVNYCWSDGTTEVKSIPWTIEKADGPAAPTGLKGFAPTSPGGKNGRIDGNTQGMEYSVSPNFDAATPASVKEGTQSGTTEEVIEGLSAGTYYVRVRETPGRKAGEAAVVEVPECRIYNIGVNNCRADKTEAKVNENVKLTAAAVNEYGMKFKRWESNGGGEFKNEDKNSDHVTADFFMPANDVTITAVYPEGNYLENIGSGDVFTETEIGLPQTSVEGLNKSLAESVLDPDEKTAVEQGAELTVTLSMSNIDGYVPSEDKTKSEAKAKEVGGDGAKVGMYFDISLFKQIGTGPEKPIHDTKGNAIKITLTVPEWLRNTNSNVIRTFYVIRNHGSSTQKLAESTGTQIPFDSTLFSTYALAYSDKAKGSGGGSGDTPAPGPGPEPEPEPEPEPGDLAIGFADLADDPYEGVYYNSETKHYEIVYTGEAIRPLIRVTSKTDGVLKEGVDYTVGYSNNTNVSTKKPAVITINGKDNFANKTTFDLYILPADLALAKAKGLLIVADKFKVESGKKVDPVMVYRGYELKSKDRTISNTAAIKSDTQIDISGKGNFTGDIVDIPVKVITNDDVRKYNIKVSIKAGNHVYNGNEQKLTVTTEDKPGELTVTAGSSKTPLEEDKDFVVCYSKNVNAGTAKVTVIGKGDKCGTVIKTFNIQPDKKSTITTALSDPDKPVYYTPKGAMPEVKVTAVFAEEGKDTSVTKDLVKDKDYKITYRSNKKIGKATYDVSFMGNYKGHAAVKGSFTIEEAPIGNAVVKAQQQQYKTPGSYRSKPYVTLGNVQLKASDYTVKYYDGEVSDITSEEAKELASRDKIALTDGENSRIITIAVAGKGNYTGTAFGTYKVVRYSKDKIDLSKAKIVSKYKDSKGRDVSVARQEYTGYAITPEIRVLIKPDKDWIEVDKTYYSVNYINNLNKGTAMILINGDGEHAIGSKNVSFGITTMKMNLFTLLFK